MKFCSALVFYEGSPHSPQSGFFAEVDGSLAEFYSYDVWRNDRDRFEGMDWHWIIFKDPPPADLLKWVKMLLGIRFRGVIHLYDGKGGVK
jgi:hypothetical protein